MSGAVSESGGTEDAGHNNYTYDSASNLATIQDAGGTTSYTYGASNLLATMRAPGDGAATSFGYNKDAQRTTTTYPNGVVLTSDYEDDSPSGDKGPGRLKSVEAKKGATVISKFTYGFKPNLTSCGGSSSPDTALRHTVTNKDGVTSKYCYDEMDRLIKADGHNGSNYNWTLDKNGNVTKAVKGAGATSFGYDAANRLCWKLGGTEPDADCAPTPAGATTYAHDTVGDLDTSSAALNLDYNSKGQTASMTGLGGGAATAFGYAGPNQFERFTAGAATFTNNALGVGAETTGTSTSYYRRDNQGALVSERLPSGAIYYYSFDGLGSVTALTDSAGTAQALYSYEPYGETTATGPAPNTANPWKYTSSYLDTTGFYKMGMRYYAPGLMRWTQQDPVEQPTDPLNANRYAYVGGNPVSRTDPSGRKGAWLDFSLGPFGGGYAEDNDGTNGRFGGSFGFSPGLKKGFGAGASGGAYTGSNDPGGHGAKVCALLCLGGHSKKGLIFGIGPEVSISFE